MRRSGNSLRVPGFPLFSIERVGSPANLRWLSITVDGVVTVHAVPNRIGYVAERGTWVQWRLVREVSAVIDPESQRADLLGVREVIETPGDGVLVLPHPPGADPGAWPENPVVTGMLARIGINRLVHGGVAWLGDTDPGSGMHADLSNYRLDCLHIMAAQAHAHIMTAMQRSSG